MRQRHLESTERCSEMVADFMADNEKRSKGLISEIEVSRRKTATSYKKELIQLAYLPDAGKCCALHQCHLAGAPQENAISEEGGKEFEEVRKAEPWDAIGNLDALATYPLLCPLRLRETLQSAQVMTGGSKFPILESAATLSLQQTFCNQRACQERQEPLAAKRS